MILYTQLNGIKELQVFEMQYVDIAGKTAFR